MNLFKKYPTLFPDGVRIECRSGWYDILDILCGLIVHHIKAKNDSFQYALSHNEMIAELHKSEKWGTEFKSEMYNSLTEYIIDKPAYKAKLLVDGYRNVPPKPDNVLIKQIKEKFV